MPYNGPSTDRTQYDADRDAQVAAIALAEQEKYEEAQVRQQIAAERAAEIAEHSADKEKMQEEQMFNERLMQMRTERQKAVEESQKAAEEGRQYPPHVAPPEPPEPEPAPEGEHNNPGFFDMPTAEDPNDPPPHHKKGKHR